MGETHGHGYEGSLRNDRSLRATDEIDATEHSSGPRRRAQQSPSQDAAIRWADQLRKMTVKAPLQSLFAAFLFGIWVARRR